MDGNADLFNDLIRAKCHALGLTESLCVMEEIFDEVREQAKRGLVKPHVIEMLAAVDRLASQDPIKYSHYRKVSRVVIATWLEGIEEEEKRGN